ncbi:hypothetical protein HDU67_007871 [Dinochytrium kinnereticum]|nr:hypothetical protein HDU67_007871 [Dinochytrium kinnereticum]
MRPASECVPYLNDASLPDTVALPPFTPGADEGLSTAPSPSNTAISSEIDASSAAADASRTFSSTEALSIGGSPGSSIFGAIETDLPGGSKGGASGGGGVQDGQLTTSTGGFGFGGSNGSGGSPSSSVNLPVAIAIPLIAVALILTVVGALLVRRRSRFGKTADTINGGRNTGSGGDSEGGQMMLLRYPESTNSAGLASPVPTKRDDMMEVKNVPVVFTLSKNVQDKDGNLQRDQSDLSSLNKREKELVSNLCSGTSVASSVAKHSLGTTEVQVFSTAEKPMIGLADARSADMFVKVPPPAASLTQGFESSLPRKHLVPLVVLEHAVSVPATGVSSRNMQADLTPGSTRSDGVMGTADFARWNCEEVASWLLATGLSPQIVETFTDHGIEGYKLLLLSDQALVNMGIDNFNVRALILFALERLRNPESAAPSSSRTIHANVDAPPEYS